MGQGARWAIASVGVGLAGCWFAVASSGPAARAGDPPVDGDASSGPTKFAYVGTKTCRTCHLGEHKSWEATRMAKTFDALAPGGGRDMRVKVGLDPDKDYRGDGECLACHVTGFGHPGGYEVPEKGDRTAAREAKARESVGCEACHGPGSEYVKLFREIAESGRKYRPEELYAAGLNRPEASMCIGCHNERSTGFKAGIRFDYEKMKDQGRHEVFPLKQREGP